MLTPYTTEMSELISILISVAVVSSLSFIGALTLGIKRKTLDAYMMYMVAFAAGTLIGGAFLHLLPESLVLLKPDLSLMLMVAAFSLFFMLERVVHWRHCHDTTCRVHSFGTMSLIGDGLHNFIDGLTIAAAYSLSFEVGVAATLAIIMHEIPQELGDFMVLLKSGFSTRSALTWNFLSASIAVLGGVVGFLLAGETAAFSAYLLPLAAGGFLYIGATDLLPELQKETSTKAALLHVIPFILGVVSMYALTLFE